MRLQYFFALLVFVMNPVYAFQTLFVDRDCVYEVYEYQDFIPNEVLQEGQSMYFEAFLHPKLHEGKSLKELQIDEIRFRSYEEFIADMSAKDFESYQTPNSILRLYFQVRRFNDNKIVGVAAVLRLADRSYYIDHFGVHKGFRKLGIGQTLLIQLQQFLSDAECISLDTRVFNTPAQALYEKMGFRRVNIHPNPKKQTTYIHYVLDKRK